MSQSSEVTSYSIQLTLNAPHGDYDMTALTLTGGNGWDDNAVAAYIAGLEALPLPAGVTASVTVSKNTQTSIAYTTNTAVSPITFT